MHKKGSFQNGKSLSDTCLSWSPDYVQIAFIVIFPIPWYNIFIRKKEIMIMGSGAFLILAGGLLVVIVVAVVISAVTSVISGVIAAEEDDE